MLPSLLFSLILILLSFFTLFSYKTFSSHFSLSFNHQNKIARFYPSFKINYIINYNNTKAKKGNFIEKKHKQSFNCNLIGLIYPHFAIFRCNNKNIYVLKKGEKIKNCIIYQINKNETLLKCNNNIVKMVLNIKDYNTTQNNYKYTKNENYKHLQRQNHYKNNISNNNLFTVKRENAIKLITSGKIFYQMGVVPYYKDGKIIGFKVIGVKPNSFVYKMGIRRGDIILSVNNYPIRSMEEAFSAFERLKNSSEINIKLLRNGKITTLSYLINWGGENDTSNWKNYLYRMWCLQSCLSCWGYYFPRK